MGHKPKIHRLNNECSNSLKDIMKEKYVMFKLVPPHIHRRNSAERATRPFKEHFVAGLASIDPVFLMHLWCRLLSQAEMIINMIRASRVHPKISAYNEIRGAFGFNNTL